jgi:hypothetical protein
VLIENQRVTNSFAACFAIKADPETVPTAGRISRAFSANGPLNGSEILSDRGAMNRAILLFALVYGDSAMM